MIDKKNLRIHFLEKLIDIKKEELWYYNIFEKNFIKIDRNCFSSQRGNLVQGKSLIAPSENKIFQKAIDEVVNKKASYLVKDFHMLSDMNINPTELNYQLYNTYIIPHYDENKDIMGIMLGRNLIKHNNVLLCKYTNTINNISSCHIFFDDNGKILEINELGICATPLSFRISASRRL